MIPDAEILKLRNLLIYGAIAAVQILGTAVVILVSSGSVPILEEGGQFASLKTPALGALAVLLPALGSWVASNRPRLGSEQIAAQVDAIRTRGGSRRRMRVTPAMGTDERHLIEHEQCRLPGLLAWVGPVRDGEMLDVLHVRHLDGRRFDHAETVTCDNCDAEILFVFARGGQWLARSDKPVRGN